MNGVRGRSTRARRRRVAAGLVLLAAVAGACMHAGAAEPGVHGDWVVQCATDAGEQDRCQMSQILTAEGTGDHVMTVVLRVADEGAGLTGLVRLPHGLDLPAGVALDVDERGAPLRAAIGTSDAAGVYAQLPLDARMVAAMRAGRTLNVSMRSVKGEVITLGVSLAGFTAAAEALTAKGEDRP
ncbi:MAG: invasion associated locus B family protein [Roseitalea porphyridii]|uniref:invasion associated locus B family protein n=2 Tax=Roseitalea porphyridii TaxID=1852022 RepID=UPI0032F04E5A